MALEPAALAAGGAATVAALNLASRVRERRERHWSEARRISAWPLQVTRRRAQTDDGLPLDGMGPPQSSSVLVRVSNRNDVAIEGLPWVKNHYGPDSGSMGGFEQVFPPGETDVWVDGVDVPEGGLAGLPYVHLTFSDTRGRRWEVGHDGRLRRDRFTVEGLEQSGRWRARRWLRRRLVAGHGQTAARSANARAMVDAGRSV